MIYSDLAQTLQLQKANRIEELCKENSLLIQNTVETRFFDDEKNVKDSTGQFDPLFQFKAQSKIKIYEITRIWWIKLYTNLI